MSSNSDTEVVLRGVTHGAVDYLLKPINIKELRNIWQHVVRQKAADDSVANAQGAAGADAGGKKRAAGDAAEGRGGQQKKQRVVWSVELHQKFVNAVNLLGIESAPPPPPRPARAPPAGAAIGADAGARPGRARQRRCRSGSST